MSLILDALNRSRQDADTVPGLDTLHYGTAGEGKWRRRLPWLALLAALLVIVWLLLARQPGPPPAPAADRPPAEVVTPTAIALVAPVETAAVTTAAVTTAAVETAAVETAAVETAPVAIAAVKPAAATGTPAAEQGAGVTVPPPRSAPAGGGEPGVAALYQQRAAAANAVAPAPTSAQAAASSPSREEEVVDLEQLVLKAREEVEDARLAEHEAPFIAALSQQTKNDIPTILYQRHDYSGVAARSSVVLNGKSLQTGGTTDGVKVDEILPDSVVLSYRGTRFRLRALNSWVNL